MKARFSYRPIYKFFSVLVLLSLLFSGIGISSKSTVYAQQTTPEPPAPEPECFTLELIVSAGSGTLEALTSRNCESGYSPGTVIELLASPAEGFILQAWQGTDDDLGLDVTNFVIITANQSVSVLFKDAMPVAGDMAEKALATISGKVTSRRWPYEGVEGVSISVDTGQTTTTAWDGTYSIPNVSTGTRTITATKSDWWATGTSASDPKTVNVSSSTTVNFNQFAVKAAANASISVSSSSVVPGATFNVTVSLRNSSYAVNNVKAYLDLSFDDTKFTVGTPTGTGWTGLTKYPVGSTIWGVQPNREPYQLTSTSHLVSAERLNTSFGTNTTYSFTVPITVKSNATPGTATLYYRGTIGDERDPDSTGSGTRDQQGWNAYTTTINVTPFPLDLVTFQTSPTNPSLGIGDTLTVRYQINNPNSTSQNIYLITRARTPTGTYTLLKDSAGQSAILKTITPGTNWYEWQVKIYDGAPATGGYSLTGFISPTTSWTAAVDSINLNNAFTIVAPQPELSAFLSPTNTIPYKWRTVSFWSSLSVGARAYEIWTIIDSGQTIPASTPLSQYTRKIYSIYVIDTVTNTRVSPELATTIVLDTENRLLLANNSISPAIPITYLATGISTRNDNSGASYQYAKSRVTSTIPENLMYRGTKGLDDPDSRKQIYKIILLELILNQEMSENDLFEELGSTWGLGSEILEKVEKAVEASQITNSASDPFFSSIRDLENSANAEMLKNNLKLMGDALDAMSTGATLSGDVYEAYLMQALANAQAEERIRALETVIAPGSLPGHDYLLAQAFAEAKLEYYEIKNSYFTAFRNAATDGSTLQNLASFGDYINMGLHAWSVAKWAIHPSFEVFKASHPTGLAKGAKFNPYAFVLTAMWDNFVKLDGKLHLLRQADLSIVLSRQIESYLISQKTFPATIDHDQSTNLLMLNYMRQYLGYLHFRRLGEVLDGQWYDFLLLDVVDGLMGFYTAFYPDFNTARADYEHQESLARDRYSNLAPPYFLLNLNDKFSPLIVALESNATTNLVVAPPEISTATENEYTLLFRLRNTSSTSGIYYISVSMDNGLVVTQPQTSDGIWTRYDIGSLIYYRDVTPNPRASSKLLYEATGTLLANGEVNVSLKVKKTSSGIFNLYYRAAMRAQNAPNLNENYTRDPATGTITDQQGWPAKTIKFTQPQPVVSSNLNSLQLELGAVKAFTFTLQNNGGTAGPAYIDVSVSPGLDIIESYPLFAWDCYPPGSNIWHAGETTPRPSEYLLCSSVQTLMSGQQSRTFTILVKSKALGSQWIEYRAAMNPVDSPTRITPDSFVRAPSSGPVDQQGWSAYTIPVTIWENHPPSITSFSPNPPTVSVDVGQAISFSVVAQDQDPQSTLSYLWLLDGYTVLGINQSIQWTPNSTNVGQHTIDAIVRDGALFTSQRWSVTVQSNNIVTTTVITNHSPNPSIINQSYTVSVTVSATSGTPTGTVTVTDGSASCNITLASGMGSCSLASTTAGIKTLTANYAGNSTYNSSSGSVSHTVNKIPTITTITSDNPDPSTINQSYAVSVTVRAASGTPTGTVTISEGSASCIAILSTGIATCNLTSTSGGTKTLTASYSGNATYAPSSGTSSHTVSGGIATTTTITSDTPDPSLVSQNYVVSVMVSATSWNTHGNCDCE